MRKFLVISTLSAALMSGVALAQSVDGTMDVSGSITSQGAPVQEPAPNPTAEEVGEAINQAAEDAGEAIENAFNDVSRVVNEAANDIGEAFTESSIPRGVPETSGQNEGIDDVATASIDSSTSLGVTLRSFGTDANAFFADENRTTLVSEPEFAAAFYNLPPERQAELRDSCATAGTGGLEGSFCAAVSAL